MDINEMSAARTDTISSVYADYISDVVDSLKSNDFDEHTRAYNEVRALESGGKLWFARDGSERAAMCSVMYKIREYFSR